MSSNSSNPAGLGLSEEQLAQIISHVTWSVIGTLQQVGTIPPVISSTTSTSLPSGQPIQTLVENIRGPISSRLCERQDTSHQVNPRHQNITTHIPPPPRDGPITQTSSRARQQVTDPYLHNENFENKSNPSPQQGQPITWTSRRLILKLNPTLPPATNDVPNHSAGNVSDSNALDDVPPALGKPPMNTQPVQCDDHQDPSSNKEESSDEEEQPVITSADEFNYLVSSK